MSKAAMWLFCGAIIFCWASGHMFCLAGYGVPSELSLSITLSGSEEHRKSENRKSDRSEPGQDDHSDQDVFLEAI
jgi:hypothetical protein